ncbi:Inner membrane ABC transporter permease protein YcjP [Labrenzia sp. THAF82]|uniref:carbohydrate ABC transporter permease n=1 Tax=Labrenzia sp. THAF82 TaxID=2587861 RepID=UPI001267857E|nr:carbohydrate ABC transporter permease [Labrenzia sp. THAF82]QFT34071.1 Inner membrane ABC transporter permease protein YcjP [Labrenzia sp. THAF82]
MSELQFKRAAIALTLFWLFFCLFPVWWIVVTAFKPPHAVSEGATYLPFIDYQPTLQAFKDALSGLRGDFAGPILSSVIVSVLSTILSVLLGAMAAYALVRFEFRVRLLAGGIFAFVSIGGFAVLTEIFALKVPFAVLIVLVFALAVSVWANQRNLPGPVLKNDDVTFWFVSQRMFPPIVSAFALFLLYAEMNKVGFRMLDSLPGLVLAYTAFGLPFSVWLMRDFFETVPIEVEEAATVDGIGRGRIFFQIVLPMAKPGLIATSMIILAFIWNEFLFALLLTSSKWQTLPILMAGQNSSRGDEWWAVSVAALISILPMIVVATFLGRMMRSGLLAGSIK